MSVPAKRGTLSVAARDGTHTLHGVVTLNKPNMPSTTSAESAHGAPCSGQLLATFGKPIGGCNCRTSLQNVSSGSAERESVNWEFMATPNL